MFEYEKVILHKVSFSNDLFKKELLKAITFLQQEDIPKFKYWVIDNFYHTHYEEIRGVL